MQAQKHNAGGFNKKILDLDTKKTERGKTKATHEGSCLEKEENKQSLWGRSHQLERVGEWNLLELQKACTGPKGECDRKSDE